MKGQLVALGWLDSEIILALAEGWSTPCIPGTLDNNQPKIPLQNCYNGERNEFPKPLFVQVFMASLHSFPIANRPESNLIARAAPDLTDDTSGTLKAFLRFALQVVAGLIAAAGTILALFALTRSSLG